MIKFHRVIFAFIVLVALLFCQIGQALADSTKLTIGDVLAISLPGETALTGDFSIDRKGEIQLPEVGSLLLNGLTLADASASIREKLGSAFKDIDRLTVRVKDSKLVVAVGGQVKQPGTVELPGDANIQVAISAAGGIAAGAQLDGTRVIRGSKTIYFNYKKFLDTGDMSILPSLEPLVD